jgi:choice-of-anchor C domain-containing protein
MIKTTILTMTILIAGIITPALNNASVFAATNIVSNGSFEDATSTCTPGFDTLFSGSTTITGWTVGGNSIDWICGYWSAADGTHSLDMSGNNAGSISQDLSTIVGATYTVEFYLSGNDDGGNHPLKHITVSAASDTDDYYPNEGTNTNMNWQSNQFDFTATSSTTTLTFTSNESNAYGPALDNVSAVLSECPEGYEIEGDTCVLSNQDPICDATSNVTTLWAPNHKMVPITLSGGSDPDGDSLTLTVTKVEQDEPTNGLGDGDKSPDVTLSPLQVRSERSGTGDGRVYEISYTLDDGNGGSCDGSITIGVPHSVKKPVVDSIVRFDSTS